MSQQILELVEKSSLKAEVPSFAIGDTIDVHTRILEGEKERIQIFSGVVIARSGSGSREMFSVRRIVQGEGVERKFPLHSPKIAKIEVKRSGVVRRAKLYFLRDRVGKAVRLRQRRGEKQDVMVPGEESAAAEPKQKGEAKREPAAV
jgi:large subunit ribosomal protein L19